MADGKSAGAPTLTKQGMGIVEGMPLEIADDSPGAMRDALQMLLDMEAIRLQRIKVVELPGGRTHMRFQIIT